MDAERNIYELTDEQKMAMRGEPTAESIEAVKDVARLGVFLKIEQKKIERDTKSMLRSMGNLSGILKHKGHIGNLKQRRTTWVLKGLRNSPQILLRSTV